MISPFLSLFGNLANKLKSEQAALNKELDRLDQKHKTNALSFISEKPPEAQAEMIDSANIMRQTNAAAGVSNPAAAMLQSNAQAAPMTPSLPMFDPRSSAAPKGVLAEPEESEETKTIKQSYKDVQDKQAFLQNRQRQPFNFYG